MVTLEQCHRKQLHSNTYLRQSSDGQGRNLVISSRTDTVLWSFLYQLHNAYCNQSHDSVQGAFCIFRHFWKCALCHPTLLAVGAYSEDGVQTSGEWYPRCVIESIIIYWKEDNQMTLHAWTEELAVLSWICLWSESWSCEVVGTKCKIQWLWDAPKSRPGTSNALHLPRASSGHGQRTFNFYSPKLWNALPPAARKPTSLKCFCLYCAFSFIHLRFNDSSCSS